MSRRRRLQKTSRSFMLDDRGLNKSRSAWFNLLVGDMNGTELIIGVDEVGLGCVFGPMCLVAAANPTGWRLPGIRDSKAIKSEKTRQALAAEIRHNMVHTTVMVDVAGIDRCGTYQCLLRAGDMAAMTLAERLHAQYPQARLKIIFDGDDHPDKQIQPWLRQMSIPKADATCYEVSAASILAKVTRDNWIHDLVKEHPELRRYDLDRNKGYGVSQMKAATIRFGPTQWHRAKATSTLLKRDEEGSGHGAAPTTSAEVGH